jgi:hypothetical protein
MMMTCWICNQWHFSFVEILIPFYFVDTRENAYEVVDVVSLLVQDYYYHSFTAVVVVVSVSPPSAGDNNGHRVALFQMSQQHRWNTRSCCPGLISIWRQNSENAIIIG